MNSTSAGGDPGQAKAPGRPPHGSVACGAPAWRGSCSVPIPWASPVLEFRRGLGMAAVPRETPHGVRNARQAIEATGAEGSIEISAGESASEWWIRVGDTGPGLPDKAREHLFEAFQGGARKGGIGLGLAIAAELIRGHGGRLELARSDVDGTEFLVHLPKTIGSAS